MITFTTSGSFNNIEKFLNQMKRQDVMTFLDKYGYIGQLALASSTPVDSSLTATSWYYEVEKKDGKYSIVWRNSHVEDGVPIAILIQYGHATRNGGYVQGRDYINPAIQPLFDRIADDLWERVKRG